MTATPARIRDLFLNPRPTYSPTEAAEAVGMKIEEVWGMTAVGSWKGSTASAASRCHGRSWCRSRWTSGIRRMSKERLEPS